MNVSFSPKLINDIFVTAICKDQHVCFLLL